VYLMQYSSLPPPPGANPKQYAAIRRKTEVSRPHRALIQSLTVPQCPFWHPICLFGIPFAFYGIHLPFWRPICLLAPICLFWRPICLPAPICLLAPHMPLWHPICLLALICLFGAPFVFWRRLYGAPFAFRHPHLPLWRPICLSAPTFALMALHLPFGAYICPLAPQIALCIPSDNTSEDPPSHPSGGPSSITSGNSSGDPPAKVAEECSRACKGCSGTVAAAQQQRQ
jgi:hypothetical protein